MNKKHAVTISDHTIYIRGEGLTRYCTTCYRNADPNGHIRTSPKALAHNEADANGTGMFEVKTTEWGATYYEPIHQNSCCLLAADFGVASTGRK